MSPELACDNNDHLRCTFDQLLCIEFDVIFYVDLEIDPDSICITCGDGRSGKLEIGE